MSSSIPNPFEKINDLPESFIPRLILHFNIDKTLILRDSKKYNSTSLSLLSLFSSLIWGESTLSKYNSKLFKRTYDKLEFYKEKVPENLINYKDFLEDKYKYMTREEHNKLYPNDEDENYKSLSEINFEIEKKKIEELCKLMKPNHPGYYFQKEFLYLRKMLRIDEKIINNYDLEINDDLILNNTFAVEYKSEKDKKKEEKEKNNNNEPVELNDMQKFKLILQNGYYKIILSFFNMFMNLKKNKQDFCIVFRFFGHEEKDIKEFIYEFNMFLQGLHPRFCGYFGFNKFTSNEYIFNYETSNNLGIIYRIESPKDKEKIIDKVFFETLEHPPFNEIERAKKNIDEFYLDPKNPENSIIGYKEYKDIYMFFMEKLNMEKTFVLLDDYSYYINHNKKHGKLYLIDPYDFENLHIFFDSFDKQTDYDDEIDIINVVTKEKMSFDFCKDKFLVNTNIYEAILDSNYFIKKINHCIHNRKSEILKFKNKDFHYNINYTEKEIENNMKQLPSDIYLTMNVLPLLKNALTMCELVRPKDPIVFIANYMLMNKQSVKNLGNIIKENNYNKPEEKFEGDEIVYTQEERDEMNEEENKVKEEEEEMERLEDEKRKEEEEKKRKEEEERKKKEEESGGKKSKRVTRSNFNKKKK